MHGSRTLNSPKGRFCQRTFKRGRIKAAVKTERKRAIAKVRSFLPGAGRAEKPAAAFFVAAKMKGKKSIFRLINGGKYYIIPLSACPLAEELLRSGARPR